LDIHRIICGEYGGYLPQIERGHDKASRNDKVSFRVSEMAQSLWGISPSLLPLHRPLISLFIIFYQHPPIESGGIVFGIVALHDALSAALH
jgi:hypothetical protein